MLSPAVRQAIVALAFLAPLAALSSSHAEEGEKRELLTSAGKAVVREAADYGYRRWLRQRIWRDDDESRYGLVLDKDWRVAAGKSPELPLVIIVHGFNSTPARNAAVMALSLSGRASVTVATMLPGSAPFKELVGALRGVAVGEVPGLVDELRGERQALAAAGGERGNGPRPTMPAPWSLPSPGAHTPVIAARPRRVTA